MNFFPRDTAAALPMHRPDIQLRVVLSCLLGCGIVLVTSSSLEHAMEITANPWFFVQRHLAYLAIALMIAGCILLIPMNFWRHASVWVYIVALVLLLLTMLPGIGMEVNGSRRWLSFGVLQIQPAEFLKICLILYLARILERREGGLQISRSLPFFLIGAAFVLLFMQPDFGTAAVLASTVMSMLLLGGIHFRSLLLLSLAVLGGMIALIVTSPYRLERLRIFQDPWVDPYGSGYQLIHSLIAFGRGGWFGSGLGDGIQKQLYLPAVHNDFIFAVVAEELGIFGVLVLAILFAVLVWRILYIARCARRKNANFSANAAYGIAVLFGIQAFVNMGVSMGVLPPKGLTLPFVSYGGSSLLACILLVALVLRMDHECTSRHDHHGGCT